VIPAIDLRGGRCVRLVQGDFVRETVYGADPVEMALRWQREGAGRLHVVDLDGARDGAPAQFETIRAIVKALDIPVQVGGGIRSAETAERYVAAGVDRFVLGTAAVRDPALVITLVGRHGAALVVGIDARDGMVATAGWLDTGSVAATDLAARMHDVGVGRFIFTDIARDGTLAGPNIGALAEFAAATPAAVIASGGVGRVADVRALSATGVEAVIVGRALYTADITLADAIGAAAC